MLVSIGSIKAYIEKSPQIKRRRRLLKAFFRPTNIYILYNSLCVYSRESVMIHHSKSSNGAHTHTAVGLDHKCRRLDTDAAAWIRTPPPPPHLYGGEREMLRRGTIKFTSGYIIRAEAFIFRIPRARKKKKKKLFRIL